MTGLALKDDTICDFTSQISGKLGSPITTGSFGDVYRCTIQSSKGETEAAVKVFKIDRGRATEGNQKRILRELKVWLRLQHLTIVPLLGIAYVEPPFPALVSQWMSSGTLPTYLRTQVDITTSTRFLLVKGVAGGLDYLHSENVVHGDLHPENVLIDRSGNPCLTDFGLSTVAGDVELQLTTLTAERSLDSRWRAPEVIGIGDNPEKPSFKSDIYSFGGVMFFIVTGDIPWKQKRSPQIILELCKKGTPARPNDILDNHWGLIQKCWSWDPGNRPRSAEVLDIATMFIVPDDAGLNYGSSIDMGFDLPGQISFPETTSLARDTNCSTQNAVAFLRAYQPTIKDHFYTTDSNEMINAANNLGYNLEGTAAYVYTMRAPSTVPLYRMYSSNATDHFYTTSYSEVSNAVANCGYTYEEIAAYVYDTEVCGSIPFYRMYSSGATDHFYTTNASESNNAVTNLGYVSEGIAAYVLTARNG